MAAGHVVRGPGLRVTDQSDPRTVTEGGAPELLHRLAQTYVGPGTVFPPMPNPPPGFVTHVTVTRVGGNGPWTDTTS